MVVRADIQGGGVKRTVHGCREAKEESHSRILMSCGAVLGVIMGFNAFVWQAASQSTRVIRNIVEEYSIQWSIEYFH